jgi:hypothetical protein
LLEIAALSDGETAVEVLCVIDADQTGRRSGCHPIVPDLDTVVLRTGTQGLDGIIVTDTRAPQTNFDNLLSAVELSGRPASCVVAPSLLRISPASMRAAEEATP